MTLEDLIEALETALEEIIIGAFWLVAMLIGFLEWLFEGKRIE